MTTTFTIVASILGVISGILHKQDFSELSMFFGLMAIIVLFLALKESCKSEEKATGEERKTLLTACLDIIDSGTGLTVKNVSDFRNTFKKYRYSLNNEQKEFINHLLSAVGDVRINNEELNNLGEGKERTEIISNNRVLLNKIERSRLIIEQYLSES